MEAKMKECFKPHAVMHTVMGVGLGLVLVSLAPGLNNLWLGVGLVAVAAVVDYTRK